MKHVSMVDYYDGSSLEPKVGEWIQENKETIEIIDIEYAQHGNVYLAIVTYNEIE